MTAKCFIVLCMLFCVFTKAKGQSYPVSHLTMKDGLPSNTVYSLHSDSKGYLWIATDKGLSRYNGTTFETFTISDGLQDNEIFNITEDYQGRYWISTFKGDLCFYKDGKFYTRENTPWLKLPLKYTSFIHRMICGADGTLFNISSDGKYVVRIRNNSVKMLNISSAVKYLTTRPNPFYIDNVDNNVIELYYRKELLALDSSSHFTRKGDYKGKSFLLHSKTKKTFISCQDTGISIFSNGACSFIPASHFPLAKKKLADTLATPLFAKDSILFFNGKNPGLLGKRGGIFDDIYITFVEQDHAGNLWVSTRGKGIFCISKSASLIDVFSDTYSGEVISSKFTSEALYFLTSDGQYYIHKNNVTKKITTISKGLHAPSPSNFYILENGSLLQIHETSNFLYWLLPGGKVEKRTVTLPYPKFDFATKEIFRIKDKLYLSSISNIREGDYGKLQTNQVEWEKLIYNPGSEYDNGPRIYARTVNPNDGSIWISRADGVFRIKGKSAIPQRQFPLLNFRKLASQNGYLIGITENNKLFLSARFEDRLVADTISGTDCIWEHIYPIDREHALISTNNYYRLLTLKSPVTDNRPHYNIEVIEDPFIPIQAESIATDSSNLYFFKERTITRVASQALFQKAITPEPSFLTFKTRTRSLVPRPEIYISYKESQNINIRFDNTSFGSKEVFSQYSVSDNETDDWRDISGNEINLNTPGYGTFTVKLRSRTLSSGYSSPVVLIIHIEKPYWATWWFIALCILTFLALIWIIIVAVTWRRLRKKQKEHDADMKYQQSEYKALNALMNPHFIFNSLNNIQGLINRDEKRIANQYLVIFSDLVRQNMHNISKGFISVQEELTLIENYLTLEKLRFRDLVNYEINVEDDVDIDDIMIPPLMIQPLVENAVKHGLLPKQSSTSKVFISVFEEEDLVYIVIEDNGIGLTASLKSQNRLYDSFGLSNLAKRTEHLKKIQQHEINIEITEMKMEDGTVMGTRAVVTIRLR